MQIRRKEKPAYACALTSDDLINDYKILAFSDTEIWQQDKKLRSIKIKPKRHKNQVYARVCLYNHTLKRSVTHVWHRILYCLMIGNIPAGFVVDHIDGNKLNNDFRNLQLLTAKENIAKGRSKKETHYKLPKRKIYTEEFLLGKIDHYEKLLKENRESRTWENRKEVAVKDHRYRSVLARWLGKYKLFKEKNKKNIV